MLSRNLQQSVLTTALLAFLAAAGLAAERSASREPLTWDRDVHTAWQLALKTQRPLLVFITMDDCLYCQKMKKSTLQDRQIVHDLTTEFVPVTINVKDQPELVKLLFVKSYPTTVIILNNGDVIDSIAGYQTPRQLHERLNTTLRQAAKEQRAAVIR